MIKTTQRQIVIAMFLLTVAGCNKSPSTVPRYDFSTSNSYGVPAFKDDAPPNANSDPSNFPMAFVDADGNPVDLTKHRGIRKVVLVVLRGMPQLPGGTFCPSCLAQTSSLLANQAEFTRRNVEVLVVFPGPNDRLGEFLQTVKNQTPGEPSRLFQVCLDRECSVCDRLGIRADLAKPSTYILNTQGKLVYAYVGETSTDRPSIKAILAQLDKIP